MMTTMTEKSTEPVVAKTVTVKASAEDAFRIFTTELDSWWPRSHHIGKAPMKKMIIETAKGGRCYSEQIDGTECDWATVLVWEPPRRLVIAWQITPEWSYEPDIEKSSEVKVQFTPVGNGTTRVDLEHRFFSRHGAGGDSSRKAVDAEDGWGLLLELFAKKVEEAGGN